MTEELAYHISRLEFIGRLRITDKIHITSKTPLKDESNGVVSWILRRVTLQSRERSVKWMYDTITDVSRYYGYCTALHNDENVNAIRGLAPFAIQGIHNQIQLYGSCQELVACIAMLRNIIGE